MQPALPARSRHASGPSPTCFPWRTSSWAVNDAASRPIASGTETAVPVGAVGCGCGVVVVAPGCVGCVAPVDGAPPPPPNPQP